MTAVPPYGGCSSALSRGLEQEGVSWRDAASRCSDHARCRDGKLTELRGAIDDLVAAWKGEASSGFSKVMTRWDQDSTKLLTALHDIADLLDKGANTHQANEEQQSQMMNKYGNSLNYSS
jgi:WXG100 family type VII secretion target